ncbi:hypothetical protein ID866_5250 [Astraeus odoratus]|nr:hypothetical protein ID866_5250 [Astraeus odoratus]
MTKGMQSSEVPHGIKRKRPVEVVSFIKQDSNEARLRRKLHHDVREVRHVAKKARAFEIQRMVKKLKTARRNNPKGNETKDLEEQIEILKHVDCDKVANTALQTKIKKDKVLADDLVLRTVLSAELASSTLIPAPAGTLTGKVHNRLLSSKLLATEVSATVMALKDFLHPGPSTYGTRENNDELAVQQTKTSMQDSDKSSNFVNASDDEDDLSAGDDRDTDDGWESGTIGDKRQSMIDGWESGSVQGSSYQGELSDSVSDAGDQPTGYESRAKKLRTLSERQSTFLPTLSVGFTRGDSDSEFSDSEAKIADGIRKNRRGQRARRAIWEKKYGKNANHLKGRAENTQRAGPVSKGRQQTSKTSLRQREPLNRTGPINSGRDGHRGTPSSTPGTKWERHIGKPLHPSWEAKKKQKAPSIVPPQGTKIVFDS